MLVALVHQHGGGRAVARGGVAPFPNCASHASHARPAPLPTHTHRIYWCPCWPPPRRWFHHDATRQSAEALLKHVGDDTFVIRPSKQVGTAEHGRTHASTSTHALTLSVKVRLIGSTPPVSVHSTALMPTLPPAVLAGDWEDVARETAPHGGHLGCERAWEAAAVPIDYFDVGQLRGHLGLAKVVPPVGRAERRARDDGALHCRRPLAVRAQ